MKKIFIGIFFVLSVFALSIAMFTPLHVYILNYIAGKIFLVAMVASCLIFMYCLFKD